MYKISVDKDPQLKYEINGFGRKTINFFLIPILNSLPPSFHNKVKKTNQKAGQVVKEKTTHAALETLYHKGSNLKFNKKHFLEGFFHEVWFNTNNAKAVRNRLKLVKRLITKAILDRKNQTSISVLSIASGSARAVAESILAAGVSSKIESFFLDRSDKAIEYSKGLVDELSLLEKSNTKVEWIQDTANSFPQYIDQKLDIVEMVGLLDYFDDEKVVRIFNTIYSNLNEGGVMISSNIVDNSERKFLDKAIGWKMIYRYGEEFAELAEKAGFQKGNIEVIYEPLKVHVIIVAYK